MVSVDAYWIPSAFHKDTYICSVCKRETAITGGYKMAIDSLPRCENCGADMTQHVYNAMITDYFGSVIYAIKDVPPNYRYKVR